MRLHSAMAAAALALTLSTTAQAQTIGPAPPGCYRDINGYASCRPLGGELVVNISGQAVCGKGNCIRDVYGKIMCSTQPGGQITMDMMGRFSCVGSCEEATPDNCLPLQ
jgi:hypothetical protein